MQRIVLISCVSRKGIQKAKAIDLYKGTLFANSLAYAKSLIPDKIFILSALYHLVELEQVIEPYDVTLSNVSKEQKAKKPQLKVLTREEGIEWGRIVIRDLSKVADLKNDIFIILAGQSYIDPIRSAISNLVEPLNGLRQGERVSFLIKNKI